MHDDTELLRLRLAARLNAPPRERADLATQYGDVWDPDELRRDFEVLVFVAPFVRVRRRADGVDGLLMFQHHPRYYFAFEPTTTQS
jgi:hypothetical protein